MTIRAYTRISVDARESQSIDQQRHLIERWAEFKHPGRPVEWYSDPGTSGGAPFAQRRDGKRLLADLARGDVLVVIKIDRLARSVRDLLDVIEHCSAVGATFAATLQDLDTNGAYGRFMLHLLGALAELEKDIVSERVKAARAQLVREGRLSAGRPPYGFLAVQRPQGGYVVRPDPETGPRLREALLRVIGGQSQRSVAEELGVPHATLRNLLTNPRLYGRDPAEGGRLDPEAALLSFVEWRQLQAALTGPPKAWSRNPGYGPALRCYACDGPRLYLDTSADVYKCENRHPGRATVKRRIADQFVESWFLDTFGERPHLRVERSSDDGDRSNRLAGLDVEADDLVTLMRRPGADRAALAARLDALDAKREAVEAEPSRVLVRHVRTGRSIAEHWDQADEPERLAMLQAGGHVIVHPASRPGGRFEPVESEESDALAALIA
jgi:DNA invertase Pin-like site-specific DNA recombinase